MNLCAKSEIHMREYENMIIQRHYVSGRGFRLIKFFDCSYKLKAERDCIVSSIFLQSVAHHTTTCIPLNPSGDLKILDLAI